MKITMREVAQYLINTNEMPFRWDILIGNNKSLSERIDKTVMQCGAQFFYSVNNIKDPGTIIAPSEELLAARQLAAKAFAKIIEDNHFDSGRLKDQCLPKAAAWAQMVEVSHG